MFKNKLIELSNTFVKQIVKQRVLDTKNNRIYIQDSELVKYTNFKPGVYLQCIVDKVGNKLTIKPASEGKIKVAKRQRKDYVGSVIDIRTKSILNTFSKFDKLNLEIYEDEIIITGINDIAVDESANKVVSLAEKADKRKVLRIPTTSIQKQYYRRLAMCSGDSHQLDFTDFINRVEENVTQISFDMMQSAGYTGVPYSDDKLLNTYKNAVRFNGISKPVRFNSVCSGAGILDLGFVNTGYKPQWALELEKDMCDTYRHNLGDHVVQGDLSMYDISLIPDAEVLIGGIPCQDYSNANRVTGKIIDSPKNLLMRSFIKVAKSMESLKVFVIENVPQIITKGAKFVQELKDAMSDFEITIKKVDASKYGCAQKRERAIIIGSKIGAINLPDSIIAPVRTVRQALAGIKPDSPNQQDYTKPSPATVERMSYVPQGGNFLDIPEHLRTKGKHSNLFYRLEWDNNCKTLTNVRKSNIIHPEENRVPSIREIARLTGLFPDKDGKEFEFLGTLANKQQMLANAVPLELSTVIAQTIRKKFEEYYGNAVSFA